METAISMNCPNCGAPLRLRDGDDFLTCDYCQSTVYPERTEEGVRVLSGASDFACPVCSLPLVHAALDGRRIYYCEHCRGMLICMDLFVPLLEDLRARRDISAAVCRRPEESELRRQVSCPQCQGRMDTHYYAGPGNIVIDDCSRCGWNWLDPGELTRIVRAPERVYSS
jgi:Zn-finger nucleic acid-binding protein